MVTLDKAYIEERSAKMSSGCWHWLYAEDGNGYGVIGNNYKTKKAYRVAYEVFNGPIPAGQVVRHICNNPICVNPKHLALGTQFDNCQDAIAAGATPAGMRNGMSKLTETAVLEIRAKFPAISRMDLAKQYGCTLSMICKILNRKTWRHI